MTLLLVLAHPDDESFVGGGTMHRYRRQGCRTALLTLTDGQAGRLGVEGEPPLATRETIDRLRRDELRRASRRLGIDELITPGWMDGALSSAGDERGARLVAEHIRRLRPDVVITFGPEGGGSGHSDHQAVSRWTTAAFDLAAEPTFESADNVHRASKLYWITWPSALDSLRGVSGTEITSVVDLAPEDLEGKQQAFAEHASQQDFRTIHRQITEGFDGREYYHLARSRVGGIDGRERDLLRGIVEADRQP